MLIPLFQKWEDVEVPIVTFRLRKGDKGEILEEIKQPLVEGKIKRFYKDGSAKTFPAPSFLLVSFDLPENIKVQDLWIDVLSPTETVIYTAPVCVSE